MTWRQAVKYAQYHRREHSESDIYKSNQLHQASFRLNLKTDYLLQNPK